MKRTYLVGMVIVSLLFVMLPLGDVGKAGAAVGGGKTAPQTAQTQWVNPYPNFAAVKMTSAIDGWAAGDDGITPRIMRYSNDSWRDYPQPLTVSLELTAIDATANEAWAVGWGGAILHWQGSDWQVSSSPITNATHFADVKIVAAGEAWAIGSISTNDPPVIAHYSGGSWMQLTAPDLGTHYELDKMAWISPNDGWVVGATINAQTNSADQPLALHYQNGTWTRVSLPTLVGFGAGAASIFMLNADEGWIGLGGSGSSVTYSLLHYSGGTWQPILDAVPQTQAVSTSIIAFAGGDFYRGYLSYDGNTGQLGNYFARSSNNMAVRVLPASLSGVAANDIWAVSIDGYIYHWDGSQLAQVSGGLRADKLQMLTANEGWAHAGQYPPQGELYHYNGGAWLPSGVQGDSFAFASPTDGWAHVYVTDTVYGFRHYDGSGWGAVQVDDGNYYFNDMQMTGSDTGWAVGLLRTDPDTTLSAVAEFSGGSWHPYTLTTSSGDLQAVSFDQPNDGWASGFLSGNGPVIYHYSGGSWQLVDGPAISGAIYDVSALAPDDVWVVGGFYYNEFAYSYIDHWNGSTWNVQQFDSQLDSIEMLSPSKGWAGGDGPLLHYQNGSWQQVANASGRVRDFSFISPDDGWAAALSGPLHYASRCLDYYSDVPESYWASGDILALSCAGIVSGTAPHTFSPNAPATRSQFAKMIVLARGWPITTPISASFRDVPPTNPLFQFVETAYAQGAISGADANACAQAGAAAPCFLPNRPISRAQTALIIQQAYAWSSDTSGGPHFSDVARNNYAYAAIETCFHHGVMSGIGGGYFAPNANITRAQIAATLHRAIRLSTPYSPKRRRGQWPALALFCVFAV